MSREDLVGTTVTHRRYVPYSHAHYAGNLVDGAYSLAAFGDVATEVCIRTDGDEGLFASYSDVQFRAPVRAGSSALGTALGKWNSRCASSRAETRSAPSRPLTCWTHRSWPRPLVALSWCPQPGDLTCAGAFADPVCRAPPRRRRRRRGGVAEFPHP